MKKLFRMSLAFASLISGLFFLAAFIMGIFFLIEKIFSFRESVNTKIYIFLIYTLFFVVFVGTVVPLMRKIFNYFRISKINPFDALVSILIFIASFFPLFFLSFITIALIRNKKLLKYRYKIFNFSVSAALFFLGVRVKFKGTREKSVKLIIANHTSPLDYLLIASAMRTDPWNIVAGINLSKDRRKFFDKMIAWSIGYLVKNYAINVDRKNEVSRGSTIKRMLEELSLGKNVAIFPEGTRTPRRKLKNGILLQNFHNGIFYISWEKKELIQPIVFDFPVIWKGKEDKFFGIHPCKIIIHYLKPVDPKEFDSMQGFKDVCHQEMYKVLKTSKNVKFFLKTN